MRNILRGSTVVSYVRQSQTARLYARLRRVVSRRLGGSGSDSTETDSGSSATVVETTGSESPSFLTGSLLFAFFGLLGKWIEASWLYRWLTAESDPDVIVIDLRETWTVGPILAVLNWFVTRLAIIGEHAQTVTLTRRGSRLFTARPIQVVSVFLGGIALALAGRIALGPTISPPLVVLTTLSAVCAVLGIRNTNSWAELRETRPVRLLVAAFEPPEPPDRQGGSDDANNTDSGDNDS